LYVEALVRRAGGHDHGVGGELLAGGQRGNQVIVLAHDGGDRYRRNEFHPVPARLGHEPLGQLAAGDPVREPRVVVAPGDFLGVRIIASDLKPLYGIEP
jgi:hypothetical protein